MVRLNKAMKGGSKVKPKAESEEERLVRAEMEALAAEEENRRRIEAARLALKEKQLREQQYTRINSVKIHNQWRKLMRMTKVDELRREIEILSQNHEREVDRKDSILQMVDRDLEDSEEQYQLAHRSHLQILDSLYDLQYMRLRALEGLFQSFLRQLEDEYDTERLEIQNAHARHKKDFATLMTAMEAEFAEADAEANQEFESQREEIKNRNQEDYNVLKISLESQIDDLEQHFEKAHQLYLSSTDARTQQFQKLTQDDASAARIIERRMRRLVRLQDALTHWRTKITTSCREWEERNSSLRGEKDAMSRHYQRLRALLNKYRSGEYDRLKLLSTISGSAIQDLDDKCSMADKILRIADLCRKLETEPEKVLPYHATAEAALDDGAWKEAAAAAEAEAARLKGEAQAELSKDAASSSAAADEGAADGVRYSARGVDDVGRGVEEWNYLDRFFVRMNRALIDTQSATNERDRMNAENSDLRAILKQYLDGISVNEDVINNPANPLLIVNNKLLVGTRAAAAAQHAAPAPPSRPPAQEVVVDAAGGGASVA